MKRNIFIAVALFATMTANAQNIAVVNPSNETSVYQTLDEAVTGADPGSIIYLPGGGVQIKNDTKITKKLTIMGVSHRGDTDNADGATVIAGNLNFDKGSSGSSVIGVYISGDVNVGTVTDSVLNLTVKYCNVNSIQVKHSQSSGLVVNQCYIRNHSKFLGCNACLENNVIHSICDVNGGIINNNVIMSAGSYRVGEYGVSGRFDVYSAIIVAFNSNICYNVMCSPINWLLVGSGCMVYNNMVNNKEISGFGDALINLNGVDWNDVFEDFNKGVISPASKFHFKEDYTQYEGKIGIYGGSSFSEEKSLAPIPRIVSKKVDEQTDGSGKLHIEVTIKAK